MKLTGKKALITGGNSGIGLATARLFVAEGAQVAITGRDQKTLDEAIAELGSSARGYRVDVTIAEDRKRLFAALAKDFGRLDIVFANAGISGQTPTGSTDEAIFENVIRTNLNAAFFTVNSAAPVLNDNGSIIFSGSVQNYLGQPGVAAYAATKGGLVSMARCIAADLAPRNIRVNVVAPGAIKTPIWKRGPRAAASAEVSAKLAKFFSSAVPQGRWGEPEEIAKAVLFLASDDSSYVNAVELIVDGGFTGAPLELPFFRTYLGRSVARRSRQTLRRLIDLFASRLTHQEEIRHVPSFRYAYREEDPRINVCDFYLFRGRPGTTVMALTVNPNAGVGAPDTFRDEGLYAFRFDTNRDLREDVAFKVQFGAPAHADGGEHRHVQTFAVRRATGVDALKGAAGELIISGNTEHVVKADQGCLAYAGLAPDLFASDGAGFGAFRKALWSENRFAPEAFLNRQNFFAGKNVTAIVLEVPSSLIGRGLVHAWATASLYGHAPEVQVSRWGLPMITHLLLSDPSLHDAWENYNRAVPADEVALFSKPIRDFVEKVTALAHSAADPSAYATQLLARLCPSVLPYELDTPASFSFAGFDGRGLCDDVMDVILTLVTNTALGDGVAPDMRLMRPDFPYFGEPHPTAASSAKQ